MATMTKLENMSNNSRDKKLKWSLGSEEDDRIEHLSPNKPLQGYFVASLNVRSILRNKQNIEDLLNTTKNIIVTGKMETRL